MRSFYGTYLSFLYKYIFLFILSLICKVYSKTKFQNSYDKNPKTGIKAYLAQNLY